MPRRRVNASRGIPKTVSDVLWPPCPEGAQVCSQRREPLVRIAPKPISPEGATEDRIRSRASVAPPGYPGLPWLTRHLHLGRGGDDLLPALRAHAADVAGEVVAAFLAVAGRDAAARSRHQRTLSGMATIRNGIHRVAIHDTGPSPDNSNKASKAEHGQHRGAMRIAMLTRTQSRPLRIQ